MVVRESRNGKFFFKMELLLMLNCRNLSYGFFFFHRSATKIVYNPDTTNDDP